ncbi:hypothetical protein [Halovulum sp. GXIMD14793]
MNIAALYLVGLICLVLAAYWYARKTFWDLAIAESASKKIRTDLKWAALLLGSVYAVALVNRSTCWLNSTIFFPPIAYQCVDGEMSPDWRGSENPAFE